MTHDDNSGATVKALPANARIAREDAALEDLQVRLVRGEVSPEEADQEIIELALARLDFLPASELEQARQFLLEAFDEPEFVETRSLAPTPDDELP